MNKKLEMRGMRMNKKMEERYEEEIDKMRFNVLEMAGFKAKPRLALMAGIAIGYRMACNDINIWDWMKD